MSIKDRCEGAMYGLAIGDALGAAIEFRMPGEFEPVKGYRPFGPHGLDAGQWTDDTSMALALAESIGEKGWDLKDQASRYLDWWSNGTYSITGSCFDIGNQTRHALSEFERTGNPLTCGDADESNSGNGSIMRLAPVPIAFHSLYPAETDRLIKLAKESSAITHPSRQCLDSCVYMTLMMSALMQGHNKEQVLSPAWYEGYGPFHKLVQKIINGEYKTKTEKEVFGSGWVIQSLEAALWAFYTTDNFEDAVLKAVNLGNDSDTTGAVCGQIAGAYYGLSGIPKHLMDGLDRKDMIEKALKGIL